METLFEFFSFQDANIRYVTAGSILLGASAAIVGCFTFLRKRALVGDAVAHSVLPGVCLAFLLFEVKDPLILLAGALLTGWISLISIDVITRKSRIKTDSAIGLVLSVFFGVGILLLTAIQHSGSAAQSGLDKFLFGKAASMVQQDVIVFSIVSVILVITVAVFFRQFALLSFDMEYARVIGLPVRLLEFILSTITVLAIAVGIQAVGVVLMAALLITPAAAARYWTDKLLVMVGLSALFGGISGLFGAYISYSAPAMPTGPWIVMVVSIIAVLSIFFAPRKGLLSRMLRRRRIAKKMIDENILKLFYHLGEDHDSFSHAYSKEELTVKRMMRNDELLNGLSRLTDEGLVLKKGGRWQLSEAGMKQGRRVTRLHRLWELYLTKYLRIAPDHVHEDAEAIEHVITPEIETRLEQLLENPDIDPHFKTIPAKE